MNISTSDHIMLFFHVRDRCFSGSVVTERTNTVGNERNSCPHPFHPLHVILVRYPQKLNTWSRSPHTLMSGTVLSPSRLPHLHDSISVSRAASCFLPSGPAVITTFMAWFSHLSLSDLQTGNVTFESILLYNSEHRRTVTDNCMALICGHTIRHLQFTYKAAMT